MSTSFNHENITLRQPTEEELDEVQALSSKVGCSKALAEACAEHLRAECNCDEAYTTREMTDPNCEFCNIGQYILPLANEVLGR